MSSRFRVELLAAQSRKDFDCGNDSLNAYLRRQAGQDQRKRFTLCYLLMETDTDKVAGYFAMSAGGIPATDLPEATSKRLPRYPSIPVVRIGRLAISTEYQGQGVGGTLLFDAIRRASTSEFGVYAIVVDAIDDAAVSFYQHHGFICFGDDPRSLFLPVSDGLKQIVNRKR